MRNFAHTADLFSLHLRTCHCFDLPNYCEAIQELAELDIAAAAVLFEKLSSCKKSWIQNRSSAFIRHYTKQMLMKINPADVAFHDIHCLRLYCTIFDARLLAPALCAFYSCILQPQQNLPTCTQASRMKNRRSDTFKNNDSESFTIATPKSPPAHRYFLMVSTRSTMIYIASSKASASDSLSAFWEFNKVLLLHFNLKFLSSVELQKL